MEIWRWMEDEFLQKGDFQVPESFNKPRNSRSCLVYNHQLAKDPILIVGAPLHSIYIWSVGPPCLWLRVFSLPPPRKPHQHPRRSRLPLRGDGQRGGPWVTSRSGFQKNDRICQAVNSSTLKNDGWKPAFLLGWYIFSGYVKLPGSNVFRWEKRCFIRNEIWTKMAGLCVSWWANEQPGWSFSLLNDEQMSNNGGWTPTRWGSGRYP